jgi:hypothetical protein
MQSRGKGKQVEKARSRDGVRWSGADPGEFEKGSGALTKRFLTLFSPADPFSVGLGFLLTIQGYTVISCIISVRLTLGNLLKQ